ncbi:MAG TPA: hypothetical protein VEK38_03390, partial [Candidatus Bathyarchaeia archaeon]|nr:hypothetical protein [Candidatus Bathyarchaeia archaeon]
TPFFVWDASKNTCTSSSYISCIQRVPARSIVYIKQFHALDSIAQNYFAMYNAQAGIRFIYSSTASLASLAEQQLCSPLLAAQLYDHTLSFAPLFADEMETASCLINAYAYAALYNPLLYTDSLISAQEKQKLVAQHTSIVTLRQAVAAHVAKKMSTLSRPVSGAESRSIS